MPSNVNCFDAISKNLSIKIYRYIYAKEKCAKRDKNRGEVFDFFEKKGQKTLANKNKVCYNNQAFENGLMVKRLRRRPLTAETGVRFPMGLPKRKGQIYICPFLFGNLSGNWTGAKRLFARKPGRGRTKKRGSAGAPPKRTKRDPRVPQDEKVLTRFSQVGAPPYRVRLSVHKQTLPIGTDHLQSAPEFQMWIKIFRAPNTADRICYSVFKKEGLPSFYILLYTISARTQAFARVFFCQILPGGGK